MKKYIIALSFVLASHVSVANAEEYVEITGDTVNIRLSASADSTLVGQASKGMIFKLVETKGSWHEIVSPSGEYRYLSSSLGVVVDMPPELTDSEIVLTDACREIVAAERQAREEAEALESDLFKQIDLSRLLTDNYKLTILDKYEIAPARISSLHAWCATH